jgi:general stress protein 26
MNTELSVTTVLAIARNIMRTARYSFLITQGPQEHPNARLMEHFPPEADLTLWFGISPRSRKAAEIRANPQVTVAFQNEAENAYVVVKGSAEIIDDVAQR